MKKFFRLSVCTLLLTSVIAFADPVIKVVFEIDGFGVSSAFVSNHTIENCGTLSWTGGLIALVYTTDDPNPATFYPTVNATFTNGTDTSVGGLASAAFDNLTFTVDLYLDSDKTTSFGTIGGTLYGSCDYIEHEGTRGSLDGVAVITLTSFSVPGYNWSEELNQPAGLRSQTGLSFNIADYQSNWSSSNTTITILADESGIPEPATMCLLGLGSPCASQKEIKI